MARRYTGDASKGLLPGPAVVQTLLVGPDSDLESEGKFTDTDLGRLLEIGLEVPRESEDKKKKKKNFGGKGGPSGNKNKGVKNAKRVTALT